jgi:energy-coupling factor transporter ATP-binding protein EcfA2
VKALLDGTFLDRRENVLAFGNPGSGKTHLLSALGQELIRQGRRVSFTTRARLVQDLLRAKQALQLSRAIKKLAYYEALVIDDIGYVQQSREEMEALFTLLAERYERGSALLTSNLPFSKWEAIFKDPMTTASAMDRLVHHSVILELNMGARQIWGRTHAAIGSDLRSQKSSKRPLSLEQRRAMMAFAPKTVQCMPARLSLVPMTTWQPASTTPVEVQRPCLWNSG